MQQARCKFKVDNVTNGEHYRTVKMSPVYSQEEGSENKQFWDATPSGSFEVTVKVDALEHMEPGKEFYLDIIPA